MALPEGFLFWKHQNQHKMGGFNHLIRRLLSFLLSTITIKEIAIVNDFDPQNINIVNKIIKEVRSCNFLNSYESQE